MKEEHPSWPAGEIEHYMISSHMCGGFSQALSDFICCSWLQRPYEIHSSMPVDEILSMFKAERVHYSSTWCKGMVALLKKVRQGCTNLPGS
jgi:hypothetical protein